MIQLLMERNAVIVSDGDDGEAGSETAGSPSARQESCYCRADKLNQSHAVRVKNERRAP
jgi:hypothetical protein